MEETILDMVENALQCVPEGATAAQALDFFLFVYLYDAEADNGHWQYTDATPEQLHGKLAQFRKQMEGARFAHAMEDAAQTFRTSVMAQTPHQSGMQTASRLIQTRPQIVADQQTAAGVRLSVSVADQSPAQMSGQPAELRALELLATGKSNRQVLETLQSESLKLDRNKLKRLRAEAKGTTT